MDFVNNIESITIDLELLINALKFVSDYFEDKVHEDYSYLIRSDKDLYYELRSFYTLYQTLCNALDDIHTNCQNQIDSFYEKLG